MKIWQDVFLKEHDDLAQTKVELSYKPQGVVVGVVKGEEDLLAEINRMIAEVTEQKLYVQWLDAATLKAVKLETTVLINYTIHVIHGIVEDKCRKGSEGHEGDQDRTVLQTF